MRKSPGPCLAASLAIDPGGSTWWDWNADFVGFRVVRAVDDRDALRGVTSRVRREVKE